LALITSQSNIGPVMDDSSLKLTDKEIAATFADPIWAARFPPILDIHQAASLLNLPVGTLRDWRSRGLLNGCCRKLGKHLRFYRDRLLKHVFNGG